MGVGGVGCGSGGPFCRCRLTGRPRHSSQHVGSPTVLLLAPAAPLLEQLPELLYVRLLSAGWGGGAAVRGGLAFAAAETPRALAVFSRRPAPSSGRESRHRGAAAVPSRWRSELPPRSLGGDDGACGL